MQCKNLRVLLFLVAALWIAAAVVFAGCAPPEPKSVKMKAVKDDGYDPAKWGKVYPLEYRSWLQTKEPRPAGKSMYKKGWDIDKTVYDKLSEFPYMALLFNGWGFGIEYNEPRGHYYMLIDQQEVDPARVKAGGACLTCKTPYADKLAREGGKEFFKMPYLDAVNKIPKEHRTLGVACIDCHDNKTMKLKVSRWTIEDGLKDLKKSDLADQEMRSVVCAQCHVTYIVTKDAEMHSTDVIFPWQSSRWGDKIGRAHV
jgi:nitrite reductase (cytochrome c-552)